MVVFHGFTSVPALKSCAIDTDLGRTVGVVTGLTRNGWDEQVYVQMTLPRSPKCAIGILFWLKKSDGEYFATFVRT